MIDPVDEFKYYGTEQEVFRMILDVIFKDVKWDDSSEKTASRFLRALKEFIPKAEYDFVPTTFDANGVDSMVVIKNISFSSLCKHHLFPFFGVAHVGYIPNDLLIGASKIPRLVNFWAKRPQTQEQLSEQIANDMVALLTPKGVGVVIEGKHTCMSCRGIEQVDATMDTSTMKGVFLDVASARAEFLNRISHGR